MFIRLLRRRPLRRRLLRLVPRQAVREEKPRMLVLRAMRMEGLG